MQPAGSVPSGPVEGDAENLLDLVAVKAFQQGTACDFPATPCPICQAFMAGLHGADAPPASDRAATDAYAAGNAARASKGDHSRPTAARPSKRGRKS